MCSSLIKCNKNSHSISINTNQWLCAQRSRQMDGKCDREWMLERIVRWRHHTLPGPRRPAPSLTCHCRLGVTGTQNTNPEPASCLSHICSLTFRETQFPDLQFQICDRGVVLTAVLLPCQCGIRIEMGLCSVGDGGLVMGMRVSLILGYNLFTIWTGIVVEENCNSSFHSKSNGWLQYPSLLAIFPEPGIISFLLRRPYIQNRIR